MKKLISIALALAMTLSSIAFIGASAATEVPEGYVWSKNLVPSEYSDFDSLQVGTDPIATSNNLMIYGGSTNVNVVYDAQKGSNVLNWTGNANYIAPRWNIGGLLKDVAQDRGLSSLTVKVSVDIKLNNSVDKTAVGSVSNVGDFVLNGANGVTGIMLQENFGNKTGTWYTVTGEFTLSEADIQSINMADNKYNYGLAFSGFFTSVPYGHIDNVTVQVLVPAGYDWSDNIVPAEYSNFDSLAVGTDPIATSNNFMIYGGSTNVNVVYDAQKESNVLNWTGSANYTAPRWNIGGILKDFAEEKGLTTLKVKVSMDIKMNSTAAPDATNTVGNVGDFVLNGANGVSGIMLQENFGNAMGTWFTVTGEFTLTEADIQSIDMTDNSKNYGITFKGWVTGVPYGHIDNVVVKVYAPVELTPTPEATVEPTEEPTPTATATPTPEPTPFNGLVNGNAENGTENWGIMAGNNGSVEQVSGGANDTEHSIKFTPGDRFSWGQMGSIAYDLTPQINAEGAGTYKLSFYIKAEEGKGGLFNVGVGSMYWQTGVGAKYDPNDQTKLTDVPTAYVLQLVEITDQWLKINVEFEITEEYLAQIALVHAVRPNQAKLFFRLDGSVGAYKTAGTEFSYFVDEVVLSKKEAVPVKELTNTDAENGIENWGIMYGQNGSVEQVSGGAKDTEHSIKFTPGERFSWGQMGSIAYDLSPAIIVDEENGYFGNGAGNYELSFYIKAEEGKGGLFNVGVGSMYWQVNAGATYEGTNKTTVPTAYFIKLVEIDDQWQKVTVRFEITDEYLEQIALVHAARPNQAKLFFRLDGSVGAYKTADSEFSYFVDEVSIKYMNGVIAGANVDVGSTLTVNYYAKLTADYTSAQMVFTRNDKSITVDGVLEDGMYKFAYTGINPQCMNDNISAQLVLGDEVLDVMENYSVKKYCDNQASKTFSEIGISEEKYEALKAFMANMLIYGAEAQKHMDYNTDNLVTANSAWIEEAKTSYEIPVADINIEGNTDVSNKVYSVTLTLSNVNQVTFKLVITDEVEVYLNGEEAEVVDGVVRSKAIKAADFDEAQVLTIKKDGGVISQVEYAVNDYIANKYNSATVGEIVCALNNYGKAAVNYKAAQ